MASLTISNSPSTTTNTITVNFTTDVSNISKVELSNDGGSTYISASSFTSSSAIFNVATWSNGTYNNCKLRLTYEDSSSGGTEPGGGTTPGGGTEPGGGSTPGTETNPNILTGLIYGKSWSNSSNAIADNAACWATVDMVSVTANKRYKISCDATWLWIRSFDSSGSLVATITNGSDSNPSQYTFTANTPYIRCGCYDPNKTLTYFKLEEV